MYKRNQVEEAISRVLRASSAKPSSRMRTRVKRLLETDRSFGRTARSADPERANYAFFSSDSPGRGVEVVFSGYEAFALMIGLRLMAHGWPQGFAVILLRRIRPELEKEHKRMLMQDPVKLFDPEEMLRQYEGDIATAPVFLTIVSGESYATGNRVPPAAICRGQGEWVTFMRQQGVHSFTTFELVSDAHELSGELAKVEPRKRGRS